MTKAERVRIYEELVVGLKEQIEHWVELGGEEGAPFIEFEDQVWSTACICYEMVENIPQDIKEKCMHNDCSVSGELKDIMVKALRAVEVYW